MAPQPISIIEARERVLLCTRRLGQEAVVIDEALDRVLAQDVCAAGDVPPFRSSAMDGYALTAGPAGRQLTVVGESRAGAPSARGLRADEAIRISTGAAVPRDADAVIRQEDVDAGEHVIVTKVGLSTGENIRGAGEDMRAGSAVLPAGTTLRAPELGVAVAAGASELVVARRPTVAVLCTGDELRAPGEPLGPGQIHNSNAPMLAALAIHSGASALPAQRLADDRAATEACLAAALEQADIVVVSGGVSVGPHDHVKPALADLGVHEHFWRVALQPGGPTWFGERDGRLVFGLPGNPVSRVRHVLAVRAAGDCGAARRDRQRTARLRSGARRRGDAQSHPRAGAPGAPRAPRRSDRRSSQRSPGLAHPHVAGRSRRARADPSGPGRASGGHDSRARVPAAVALPLPEP